MRKILYAITVAVVMLLTICAFNDNNKQEIETIEKTVLIDEGYVKVTANDLKIGSNNNKILNFVFENNTDENLKFLCGNVSVNGYMIDSSIDINIGRGKNKVCKLLLKGDDLKDCGINTIADIEFFIEFKPIDYKHYDDYYYYKQYINKYKFEIKTNIANDYKYVFDDSGDVIYDENGIKMIVKHTYKSNNGYTGAKVYIKNNTEKNIEIYAQKIYVNDVMLAYRLIYTPYKYEQMEIASYIGSGKRAITDIRVLDKSINEKNITKVENIKMVLEVFDYYWDKKFITKVISIDF